MEHVSTLQTDLEQKRQESAGRKKCEIQLYRLLAEMVETERKYVEDLEQTCEDYLPLAGSQSEGQKKRRTLSVSSFGNISVCSQESFVSYLALGDCDKISPTQ